MFTHLCGAHEAFIAVHTALGIFSICSDAYTNVFHACTVNTARMAMHLHNVDPSGGEDCRLGSALLLFGPTAACHHQQM